MFAAVVSSYDSPPSYAEFATPTPSGNDEILLDVLASGLHPRVRSQAAGSHYTSTDELPLVPGIDGVGRGPDGLLRYFILPDTTMGSLAEQTVVDLRRSVVLPESSDVLAVAAAMNPAMSSWVALRRRAAIQPGQSVLVLGATGNAGRMAVQVAKLFGAGHVVAAGRNPYRLAELATLGADETVSLAGDSDDVSARLGATAQEVDIVVDYVWGEVTEQAIRAVASARTDPGKLLTWVEIGSMSGLAAPIPSAALRSVRLSIVGSGQGSVSTREILAELPSLAEAITAGTFGIEVSAVRLADVEQAWTAPAGRERVVVTP